MDKIWLSKFLGTSSSVDAEAKRRRLTLYFISYVGGTIMMIMALKNLNSGRDLMVALIAGSSVMVYLNALLSHIFKQTNLFFYLAGFLVTFMVISLVYTGGVASTGLYFIFPLIFIQIIIVGYKAALIFSTLTMLLATFLLFNQQLIAAQYPSEHVTRFLISSLSFMIVAFIAEHFWHQSHRELASDNLEKLRQANTDPLTKLPNRRFLESVYYERAMQNPADYFPLSVVAVDADHFKSINDNHGHDVGDAVLQHLANVMKNSIRASDIVARTGGEEFLIIYPQTTLSMALKLADNIREKIEHSPYHDADLILGVTASFGVATALTDTSLNANLKLADENLYQAKEAGRNKVV